MILKNKLVRNNIFFTATLVFILGCNPDETQKVTTFDTLVFQEEFNSNILDTNIWSYDIGTGNNGWGNNELQYYTNRPENIQVANGLLKITAISEVYLGSNYTSAKILTKGKLEQQYGRIEARMKMPWGKGLWPAFWMLGADIGTNPWPGSGEIDIMEYLGNQPTKIFGTVHGPGYSGGESISKSFDLQNDRFDNDFHVFGIEWGENYINFYVDDKLYNQITPEDVTGDWVFNKPYFLILNMAVGGNLPGSPNSDTTFPQEMLVDYVRVYQ